MPLTTQVHGIRPPQVPTSMNRDFLSRGFSLIEIAVVLLIVTLVVGSVVQFLITQVTAARVTGTRNKQDAIKAALITFIARNNRLPCPAIATIPDGAPGEGAEDTTVDCTATVRFPAAAPFTVATGAVPWVSLGLSHEGALDGYGNRFTYQVAIAATSASLNPQTVSGIKGAITLHNAGLGVLGSPPTVPTGNQISDCTPTGSAYNPCKAVVVVVSHGANGYGAFTGAGRQITFAPTVTGMDEIENANADDKVVVKAFSGIVANPYDDTVLALSSGDLLSSLTSTGGMQDYKTAIFTNFNIIKGAITSKAALNRTVVCVTGSCSPPTGSCAGSTPCSATAYTLPLADPAPNTIPTTFGLVAGVTNDPWGKPIQYTVTTSFISPSPPTSSGLVAYTLRSYGPDGVANNVDDIYTTIYVGELLAQLSKY